MTDPFARNWVRLASVSLLISGALALIVTVAKMPLIKDSISNLDLVRWCLVLHVNLATLVWFIALPLGLLHLAANSGRRTSPSNWLARAGFWFTVGGVLLMFTVLPGSDVEIVLSNYIPVLTHWRYLLALALFFMGVILNCLSPRLLRTCASEFEQIRFGLAIGAGFLILAVIALAKSYMELSRIKLISTQSLFELGMWGGGHLLQHASVAFLLCIWILLLSSEARRPLFSRAELFPLFAAYSLPIFAAAVIMRYPVTSNEYRTGFTRLMQWGIAPVSIIMIFLLIRRFDLWRRCWSSHKVAAVVLSAFLLVLGFTFGALIRGPDMRVPGHYHAGIGAVTLGFMTMAFKILAGDQTSRWMTRMVWTYGLGQTLFASGMFIAGSFGMGRKTYGSEHHLTNWGQSWGFMFMAIGGLAALTGGLMFARAIWPHLDLRKLFSSRTNSRTKFVLDSLETIKGFINTKRNKNHLSVSISSDRSAANRSINNL